MGDSDLVGGYIWKQVSDYMPVVMKSLSWPEDLCQSIGKAESLQAWSSWNSEVVMEKDQATFGLFCPPACHSTKPAAHRKPCLS